ncbi:hypothetical protein HWV62_45492 [Athelia sp. TMB]|nr:hypothetical protein HWV62_45492 [Athelia sp. TMB]
MDSARTKIQKSLRPEDLRGVVAKLWPPRKHKAGMEAPTVLPLYLERQLKQTPPKPQYSASSIHVTKAGHVENALREELHHDVFTNTPGFLEKIFDVESNLVQKLYKKSLDDHFYDESGEHWKAFDETGSTEKALYKPFVAVANFISQACNPETKLTWLSDPDRAPPCLDDRAAEFKPDIIAAIGSDMPVPGDRKPGQVPWTRIQVPVEVKRYGGGPSAIIQLAKYLRQCFSECIDRRHVFGLVLAGRMLTVYLADRSGILGSETFDIHDEPRQLIRVIASLTTFRPSKLGWDPTLTIYDPNDRNSTRHSFETDLNSKGVKRWRIELSKHTSVGPPERTYEAKKFIIWKKIRIRRSEVIKGRATRVWKAWAEDEMHLPASERTVYIIKDAWRDNRRDLEGALYERIGACDGVAELYSYCIVQVDGKADTTSAIRGGVAAKGPPRDIAIQQSSKNANQSSKNANQSSKNVNQSSKNINQPSGTDPTKQGWGYIFDHLVDTDFLPPIVAFKDTLPRDRTHSRSVAKTYGWPISYASSLLELIGSMRDTIVGHQNAYNRGVLHRDISEGNILITGKSLDERGKRGVLIDFDNAIFWKTHQAVMDDELSAGRKERKTSPPHGPQHDIESFFWVLVHVCIVYDGPARYRQDLLNSDIPASDDVIDLRNSTNLIFGSTQSDYSRGQTKGNIFEAQSGYKQHIDCNISKWAEPLLPLIRQFYDLLRAAFEVNKYDDLYTDVIAAFDAAEGRMDAENPDAVEADEGLRAVYQDLRDKEIARRHNDLECEDHSELSADDVSDNGNENAALGTPPVVLRETRPPPSSPETPSRKRAPKRLRRK